MKNLFADGQRIQVVEGASEADVILVLEPNYFKTRGYETLLLSEPDIASSPGKCFTYNYDDAPLPFFPGMYVGLPKTLASPDRHRGFSYVFAPNPAVQDYEGRRDEMPELLFSFRGAPSAPIRARILEQSERWAHLGRCRITKTGVGTTGAATSGQYFSELLNSKFVLCPRGQGLASIRLFETMRLGRVPVILADGWLAPDCVSWSECSLSVPENEVKSIPNLLSEAEAWWPELAANARLQWERNFSAERIPARFAETMRSLLPGAEARESEFRRRWRQRTFFWGNIGSPLKRASRRLTSMFPKMRR